MNTTEKKTGVLRTNKWIRAAIHGITLSAWAFAGLTGNNLANLIVEKFGTVNVAEGYQAVLYVTVALYIVSLVLSFVFVRPMKKESK